MIASRALRYPVLFVSMFACADMAAGLERDLSAETRLAEIVRAVESDPLLSGINRDEALVEELREAVLTPWESAWKARDAAAFAGLGDGARLDWDSCPRKLIREQDGIREYAWRCRGQGKTGSEDQSYLSRLRKVDYFRLEPLKLEPGEGRAALLVRYDLRAVTKGGSRRHDRGRLRLELEQRDGAWRVSALRPDGFESLEADRPVFEDATASWGLDQVPVTDRKEAIRRGGYAIAAADYDGDGRPDLLVGGWGPVKLYRNAGGRFEDVTGPAGLSGETLVKSAAFVDLDNDGRRDLLLLRFIEEGKDQDGDMVAYQNVGAGKFLRKGQVLTRTKSYDRTMPITVADFDLNGTLDLYLGFPGSRDFTTMGAGPQPLATQGVWLNDGKWNFTEAPKESGIWAADNVYPHSAIASDLDSDGRPDLVVMNDRAGLSPIYRNRGGGLFEEVSRESGIVNESWAMTAAAGDYDGDGSPDLVLTNIDFGAAHRILESRAGRETGPEEKAALARLARHAVGNRLFRNRGDGTFDETTDKAGIRWAGEAPAGAEWLDYSNSGRQDLYITNGLWTGGPREISSLFVRLHVNRMAPHVGPVVTNALNSPLAAGVPLEGPNPLLGILRSARQDPFRPSAAPADRPVLSLGGDQRNQLFRNNGDGTFTEVGYLIGADRIEDGYVAALADVDGDGNQDLLLRNGDPAPGRSHPTVTLLLNKTPRRGHRSLNAYLEGSRSNRDGIGARVTAWVGSRRIVREVRGPVGAAQGEPVAFFGLGTSPRVDRLEVRWPSGLREEFNGVPAGRIVLREGKGYVVLAARTP